MPDKIKLIRSAQAGDALAFQELVYSSDSMALRLAFHLTGSEREAVAMCEATFAQVRVLLPSFAFDCSFQEWVYRVVMRLWMEHPRSARPSDFMSPLTRTERAVFVLAHYHGLSFAVISQMLGGSKKGVRGALLRALRKLRSPMCGE